MGRISKYDKDFKLNAVRLCKESGMKQRDFEKETGIGTGCISLRKREFNESNCAASMNNHFPVMGYRVIRELLVLNEKMKCLDKSVIY